MKLISGLIIFYLIGFCVCIDTASVLYDDENDGLNEFCIFKGCSCSGNGDDQATPTNTDTNNDAGVDLSCKLEAEGNKTLFPDRDTKTFKASINVLEMSYNNLKQIPDERFKGLKIAVMDLSHNDLTYLSRNIFTGINQLEVLDISNNQISHIDQYTFASVNQTLISLKLTNNKLGKMQPNQLSRIISGLKYLRTLLLRNNEISYLSELQELTLLEELSLANNHIDEISDLPPNIFDLDLENNRIQRLSADSFANLKNLKYLNLESNQIYHIDEDAFTKLTKIAVLNLGRNYIKQIPSRIFFTLVNLERLDLSAQNQMLRDIEDFAFDRASNIQMIRKIDLSKNRIAKISNRAFCSRNRTYPYANIKEIDFANNQITSINSCILRQLSKGFIDNHSSPKTTNSQTKPKVSFKQQHFIEKLGPNLKCDCEITKSLNYVDFEGECESISGTMTELKNYQCSSAQLFSSVSVEMYCSLQIDFDCEQFEQSQTTSQNLNTQSNEQENQTPTPVEKTETRASSDLEKEPEPLKPEPKPEPKPEVIVESKILKPETLTNEVKLSDFELEAKSREISSLVHNEAHLDAKPIVNKLIMNNKKISNSSISSSINNIINNKEINDEINKTAKNIINLKESFKSQSTTNPILLADKNGGASIKLIDSLFILFSLFLIYLSNLVI